MRYEQKVVHSEHSYQARLSCVCRRDGMRKSPEPFQKPYRPDVDAECFYQRPPKVITETKLTVNGKEIMKSGTEKELKQ